MGALISYLIHNYLNWRELRNHRRGYVIIERVENFSGVPMKVNELILRLQGCAHEAGVSNCRKQFINEYIQYLQQLDSNSVVAVSNGECEDDGVYAPVREDGGIDIHRAKPFRADEPFPDDGHDWIRVSYLDSPRPRSL